MKKNTASPSRLNQIANAYRDLHSKKKKAPMAPEEGSPKEEAAESPSEEASESDAGKGEGILSQKRKINKIRKK